MKKFIVLIPIFLSACTTLWSYQPSLISEPKDIQKYQADLIYCRDFVWNANQTSMGEAFSTGAGGLAGNLIYNAASEEKKPIGSSFSQVDTCMKNRGYSIVKK